MLLNKTHIRNIVYDRPIPYSIYSFIGIIKTYYDLPTNVSNRIEYIMKCIGTDYHKYFNTISYENVVLGITIFAVDEFNNRFNKESPPFEVRDMVKLLYGETNVQQNIIEIYRVWYIVDATFT